MDLVDEQHLAGLEVGHDRGQIAGAFDRGARRGAERRAHLARDHVCERGLAEAGRAVEQDVIERLVAIARRLDEHAQVVEYAILADELLERARAQPILDAALEVDFLVLDDTSRVEVARRKR